MAHVRSELEWYLTQIIERFAEPDRRAIRRLEGNFSSMRIQKNPDSVQIIRRPGTPDGMEGYRNNHACLFPGTLFKWLDLEYRAVFEQEVKKAECKPDKKSIGCEVEKGANRWPARGESPPLLGLPRFHHSFLPEPSDGRRCPIPISGSSSSGNRSIAT